MRISDWSSDVCSSDLELETVRQAALHPKCKAIFAESLANPGGVVTDIQALARIAGEAGVPLIIDNTMATPYLCRPLEHGADIVVHSTTKFLSGHGNAMGGAVVDGGKNGRAAGGERVCTYGENSVVAGSLTQKTSMCRT